MREFMRIHTMVRAGLLAGASLAASVILPTLAHAESDAALPMRLRLPPKLRLPPVPA
jgi:hypothetical protein